MNLYIKIKNLRPKNPITDFKVADTALLHKLIAENLAEGVGKLLTDVVCSLKRDDVIWDQDDFEITIRSDDGKRGSRERITKHVCNQ